MNHRGRPPVENPKNLSLRIRLDKITDYYLDRLANELWVSESELVRALIKEKYREVFEEE